MKKSEQFICLNWTYLQMVSQCADARYVYPSMRFAFRGTGLAPELTYSRPKPDEALLKSGEAPPGSHSRQVFELTNITQMDLCDIHVYIYIYSHFEPVYQSMDLTCPLLINSKP